MDDASLSEWSKESDLRPDVEKRVGSNPTGCNTPFPPLKKVEPKVCSTFLKWIFKVDMEPNN